MTPKILDCIIFNHRRIKMDKAVFIRNVFNKYFIMVK